MKLLIIQSSPAPATFTLLGENIVLITLFSDVFNPCSSLGVRDQVSHPYKTTVKIVVCIFQSLNFLERILEKRRLGTEC
jgi:hypothetical protein